jgi:hypothetical protein
VYYHHLHIDSLNDIFLTLNQKDLLLLTSMNADESFFGVAFMKLLECGLVEKDGLDGQISYVRISVPYVSSTVTFLV